jgi:N-acetyl-beta-hexosaminidase
MLQTSAIVGSAELITPCWGKGEAGGPNVPDYPRHGPAEIVNPMLESTYDFLRQFFTEIAEDFPDDYVHLGMDEAYYSCWLACFYIYNHIICCTKSWVGPRIRV